MSRYYDAVVVGGGFYGCAIAIYLAGHFDRVLLLEREQQLLQRASTANQARLHTGYHYPRSFRTAASSFQNRPVFEELYQESVDSSFKAIYAIGRFGSRVSRRYFERFCRQLALPLKPAPAGIVREFNPRLVDGVFECEEYAFRAGVLKQILERNLAAAGVEVRTCCSAEGFAPAGRNVTEVKLRKADAVTAGVVFNCTYSGLNRISGLDRSEAPRLKHQLAEVCLVRVPDSLRSMGVTVMDGPFFSVMPFPDRELHSLTHVRYTPHVSWTEGDCPDQDPEQVLARRSRESRFRWMRSDAQRFMPVLEGTRLVESLFEIKTVLECTAVDDARPIAFHRGRSHPGVVSVLGGKLDNLFDVLEVIGREFGFASRLSIGAREEHGHQ